MRVYGSVPIVLSVTADVCKRDTFKRYPPGAGASHPRWPCAIDGIVARYGRSVLSASNDRSFCCPHQ